MTATHAYIGTMPCGCNVAAVVDEPGHRADTAESVRRFIADGLAIGRVALADLAGGTVRLSGCVHRAAAPRGNEGRGIE